MATLILGMFLAAGSEVPAAFEMPFAAMDEAGARVCRNQTP
jgi:hypothetical protein